MDGFVSKPIQVDELWDAISNLAIESLDFAGIGIGSNNPFVEP
jgi:hypothetical protein